MFALFVSACIFLITTSAEPWCVLHLRNLCELLHFGNTGLKEAKMISLLQGLGAFTILISTVCPLERTVYGTLQKCSAMEHTFPRASGQLGICGEKLGKL